MSRFKQSIAKLQKEGWEIIPRLLGRMREEIQEVRDSIKRPQCICIDLGSQQIKYALIQNTGTDIAVLKYGTIDLKDDALLSSEEMDTQLSKIVTELGEYPLAIAVPQNLVTSQTINLPGELEEEASPQEIKKYLMGVTTQGLGNTPFLVGYQKLQKLGSGVKIPNPYYASIAKEKSILELIGRFVSTRAPIINVLPALNAVASSFLHKTHVGDENLVLVDMGAISTHAVVVHRKQCVLAANFPIGGEYLTQHLSKALRCSFDEAEELKRSNNYLSGEHVNAIFQAAVRRWLKDLMSWFMELSRSTANVRGHAFSEEAFNEEMKHISIYLCGGASLTPGLVDYLCAKSGVQFLPWPQYEGVSQEIPSGRFAACLGAGIETLKIGPNTGSLTPDYLVEAYQVSKWRFRTLVAALCLVPILFLVFFIATTSVLVTSSQNAKKITEIDKTTQEARTIISEYRTRDKELLSFAPILRMHKRTIDALNILKSQQDMVVASSNQLWFLLLADKHTYLQGTLSLDNYTNLTLEMGDAEDISLGKYTYITELCTLTNRSSDPQRLFFNTVRDELTNLFFVDYADTLLSGFFNTNYVDPKYVVGGDRFGTVFTTKGILSEDPSARFSSFTHPNTQPPQAK